MRADDDEIGLPPLRLLLNGVVNVLADHVDDDRCRIEFNSRLAHNGRTVIDDLLTGRLKGILIVEDVWRAQVDIDEGNIYNMDKPQRRMLILRELDCFFKSQIRSLAGHRPLPGCDCTLRGAPQESLRVQNLHALLRAALV
jgi:hypothetical protein